MEPRDGDPERISSIYDALRAEARRARAAARSITERSAEIVAHSQALQHELDVQRPRAGAATVSGDTGGEARDRAGLLDGVEPGIQAAARRPPDAP
jgi:hypothetical protein